MGWRVGWQAGWLAGGLYDEQKTRWASRWARTDRVGPAGRRRRARTAQQPLLCIFVVHKIELLCCQANNLVCNRLQRAKTSMKAGN